MDEAKITMATLSTQSSDLNNITPEITDLEADTFKLAASTTMQSRNMIKVSKSTDFTNEFTFNRETGDLMQSIQKAAQTIELMANKTMKLASEITKLAIYAHPSSILATSSINANEVTMSTNPGTTSPSHIVGINPMAKMAILTRDVATQTQCTRQMAARTNGDVSIQVSIFYDLLPQNETLSCWLLLSIINEDLKMVIIGHLVLYTYNALAIQIWVPFTIRGIHVPGV